MGDELPGWSGGPYVWYGQYGPVASPFEAWQAERLAAEAERLDGRLATDRRRRAAAERSFDKRLAADRAKYTAEQQGLAECVVAVRQSRAAEHHVAGDPTPSTPTEQTRRDSSEPAGSSSEPSAALDDPNVLTLWKRAEFNLPATSHAADGPQPNKEKGK